MTDDPDDLFVEHDGSDAAAVAALLGPAATVQVGPPADTLHDTEAPADRTPQDRATAACLVVIRKLPHLPAEVEVTAGTWRPSAALDGQERAWLVRLIPTGRHLCLIACTRRVGADWEKACPPVWLDYPARWDADSEAEFRATVTRRLRDLAHHLDRVRQDTQTTAQHRTVPGAHRYTAGRP